MSTRDPVKAGPAGRGKSRKVAGNQILGITLVHPEGPRERGRRIKPNENVTRTMTTKARIILLTVFATILLNLGGMSSSAATALILARTGGGWVHAWAVAPTKPEAIRQAQLNLMYQGYPAWPSVTLTSEVPGYGALVAETDANGYLLYIGYDAGKPTLDEAVRSATQRAVGNGARTPRTMSAWADVALVNPRTLSPLQGQAGVHRPTTLTWGAVPFAGSYEVQIEYVPAAGPAQLVDRSLVTGLSYVSSALGPGRNYRWRVQAISEERSVRSPWSPYSRFSTRVTR